MQGVLRTFALAVVMTGIAIPAVGPKRSDEHAPSKRRYLKRTFSPAAVARAGAAAAIGEARNSPHEWGRGIAGFEKRIGSAFGAHIVKNSIQYPVAYLRHEALGYQPSNERRFLPRLRYALESTVITHKTTTGKRTVAAGEISGLIGSGLISRLWQPASTHTIASGFSSAGIALGADAGMNVAREFWPRHPKSRSSAKHSRYSLNSHSSR
jgi:hypothetical protein